MGKIDKLLFCDVETNGDTDENKAEILEIAACLVDPVNLRIVDGTTIHQLIKPLAPLSDWSRAHGFGEIEAMGWPGAVALDDALCALAPVMPGATWAGQNPTFDMRFLRKAFAETGRAWPELDYHTLDVASMVYPLVRIGALESVSLKSSRSTLLGYKDEQTHRALPDMLDAIEVFARVCDMTASGYLRPVGFGG